MSLLLSLGPHPHPSVCQDQLVGGLDCSVVVKAPQTVEGLLVSTWWNILLLHWDQVGHRHDLGRAGLQSCDLEVQLYDLGRVGLQSCDFEVQSNDLEVLLYNLEGAGLQSCDLEVQLYDLEGVELQSCDLEMQSHDLEGVGLQTWEYGVQLHDLGWVGRQSLAVHQPAGCTAVGRSHSGPGRVHRLQQWTERWLVHDSAALHSQWAPGYTQCLQGRVVGLEWWGLGEGAGLQHLRV